MSNDSSSLEVIRFDLEDESLLVSGPESAIVDKIEERSQDNLAVYVKGDGVSPDSPPRKLNKKMLEHGYSYVDWVMNGSLDDNRAIFEYTEN